MSPVTAGNKKVTLHTTFNLLREADACTEGYRKLAKHLGGVNAYGADTPINLLVILESNSVDDMLWSLRATLENCDKVARLLAADFAESALPLFEKHYPNDGRPRAAIIAARDFAEGKIDAATLNRARAAAGDAARAAAGDAAGGAAGDAAGGAARAAAWGAARAAAWDAAGGAARAAAWDAAGGAARAAAWGAARDAARAAAWDAARDAARAEQAQMILAALAFDEVTA